MRDKHFSEIRNADIVAFCRGTGLRRSELELVTGDRLYQENGKTFLRIDRGTKGGRPRSVPVIGDVGRIRELCRSAGSGRVFPRVPGGMDVHSYRAEYATA